jgi:hypothetical protein
MIPPRQAKACARLRAQRVISLLIDSARVFPPKVAMPMSNEGDRSQSKPCSRRMNHTAMPFPPTQQDNAAIERGFPPSYLFCIGVFARRYCRPPEQEIKRYLWQAG